MKKKWIVGIGIILIGMAVTISQVITPPKISLLHRNVEALAAGEIDLYNPPPECVRAPGRCMGQGIIWNGIAFE